MRLNTEHLVWPSLKKDYFNIMSTQPRFLSERTLVFSNSGYIRVCGGSVLWEQSCLTWNVIPFWENILGPCYGIPVQMSHCQSVSPGIRAAMVLPSPVCLVRQSHWLLMVRPPAWPGSCSPRFHGIWFASSSLNVKMLIIGWLLFCSSDVT